MLPWKLLFRFFSALVLMATGGFAAGHDLPLPFDSGSAPVVAAPAPSTTTTTTTQAPAVDDSTTTTTAPDPVVIDPVPTTTTTRPAPTEPETPPVTTPPATIAPLKPAPARAVPDPAPARPVDDDAPAVCAAAATTVCGPAAPAAPTADDSHAARVQRCQDWWNSLADAFTAHNRPEWAARARAIAARCDEFVTRWEKWDHHRGDHPAPRPVQPPAKQVSRHGERRH